MQQNIQSLLGNNFTSEHLKTWQQIVQNIIQIRNLNQALSSLQTLGVAISSADLQKITDQKQKLQQATIDLLKLLII